MEKTRDELLVNNDKSGKLASTLTSCQVLKDQIETIAVSALNTEENVLMSLSATVEVRSIVPTTIS